ncbi:phosphotyrosine protein phosphatase [Sphingomonas sp. H39-1-10]|uniref:arsenate reductase/protein-tyrosine-phosphatase family protein n=1 Tax=Sphingomonas TaxID=13687 RepID=UPI000B898956|nr:MULTISPECIES: phosphotyrosine protein phosphatase [Sphingomonas]MDF0488736.1 phosphotyrosine protein phosphatase [Sphingomonas pollutisoli]
MIDSRYGTFRGLIRLALTRAELVTGDGGVSLPDRRAIRRLVFVCHGNICRSAFADVLARAHGLHAASFGLSTETGKPAHPPVCAAAAAMGHDLGAHRSLRAQDYAPAEGDLLLAMETRHLRRLAADPALAAAPRTLLGLYTRPATPHLHDPYQLGDAYTRLCLERIATAMPVLAAAFPGAIAAASSPGAVRAEHPTASA